MAEANVIVRVLDQASQSLRQIASSVGAVEQKADNVGQGLNRLTSTVGGAVKALGAMAVAAGAAMGVGALKDTIIQTANAAAEANRSMALFQFYMKELGVDVGAATKIVEGLQREFGILPSQAQEAIQVLVKQGASLEQVAQVLPAIAASASAAGADVGAALMQAARGIAMSRSELVEYAGITSNFGPEQQKFAKATKTKVEALTEEQKITANINAVLRESQIELKAFRATQDPATKASNSLAAAQKELSIAIGQFTLPLLIEYQKAVAGVVKTLTGWVQSESFKKLAQEAQPYIKLLQELVTAAWGAIKAAWDNVLKPTLNAIAPLLKGVLEAATNIVKGLTALFQGDFAKAGQYLLDAFRNIAKGIWDVLSNLAKQAAEAGANIVKGLVEGIKSKWEDIANVAKGIGQNAINSLKKVLGIASPSKEFMYLGFMVVDGFTQGILDRLEAQESKLVARFGQTSKQIQDALMQFDFDRIEAEWDRWVYSQKQKAEAWQKAWLEAADNIKAGLGAVPALDTSSPPSSPVNLPMAPAPGSTAPVLQPISVPPIPLSLEPALSLPGGQPTTTFGLRYGGLPDLSGTLLEMAEVIAEGVAEPIVDILGQELEKIPSTLRDLGQTALEQNRKGLGGAIGEFEPDLGPIPLEEAIDPLASLFDQLLAPLQSFSQLLERLNPIANLVAGAMSILQPAVEALMQPLVELGAMLAQLIMPVFQALGPILRLAALTIGGFVYAVAKAWNALAWIVEKITFGLVKLYVDDEAIKKALERIADGSNNAADGLQRLSSSVNMVSGYGFTGVALAAAPREVVVVVNVSGALDPVKTVTTIRTYDYEQFGRPWD